MRSSVISIVHQIYKNNKIKDEMGRACRKHWEHKKQTEFWLESPKERDHSKTWA
jgi:hypothetical protein